MKVTLTYDMENEKVDIQGVSLNGMSPLFRGYVEELQRVYGRYMIEMIHQGMVPEGKLEVELSVKQNIRPDVASFSTNDLTIPLNSAGEKII